MAKKNLYKSSIPSMVYIFRNGKPAYFVGGRFMTDIKSEIEELEEEIKSGHPHLRIDQNETEVDTEMLDPLAVIKKKAVEEYIASQKKAIDPNNNRGTSEANFKDSVGNTATTGPTAAESTSIDGAAAELQSVSGSSKAKLEGLLHKK